MKLHNEEFIFIQLFINSQKLIIMEFKKQKKQKELLSIFLLFFFFIIFSYNSEAQFISRDCSSLGPYPAGTTCSSCSQTDADDMCNCIITLADIDPTMGFTLSIDQVHNVLNQAVSNVSISIMSTSCTHSSIIINDGTPTGSIVFPANPDASIADCVIEFTVTASESDPPTDDCVKYKVQYQSQADPIKLVLVLDISGSMYSPVYSPSGTGLSRWEVLNNAVNAFMTKLEIIDKPGDLIGLTYFTTTVVESNDPSLGDNMISSDGSQAIIQTDLAGRHPLNMTAMGLGLQKGNFIIDNNSTNGKEVILLFTDGLQNVAPFVNTIGTVTNIGTDEFNPDKSVHCYCIAMDITGGAVPPVLSGLASANGGFAYKTANGTESTLMDEYDAIFTEIYSGNSPQIVAEYRDKLGNKTKTFSFNINDDITNIIFELNYMPGDSIGFNKIEKDGIDLTSSFSLHKIDNGNYTIRSLNLPYREAEKKISSKGKWNITVSGTSTNPFKLKCFVDDHSFDYDCSIGQSSYTVGETITFNSQLSFNGNVIKDPNSKVSVILLKPGDDIGNLLATYATPGLPTDSLGDISPANQKLIELFKDESFVNALTEEDQLIDLVQDENGQFSGEFSNTKLSGVYRAIFMIQAEDKYNGKFVRTTRKDVVLKFGQLDPDETVFDIDVSQGDTGQTFVITVKPKNKFGYYLGPGFSSLLKLNLDTLGGIVSEVKDNLDGSYTYTVKNVPEKISDKDVCIIIFNEKIGCESDCYPVTKWYYVILLIILLIIIFIRKIKAKWFKILMWIILIVWIVYIVLRYLEIICYKFL